LIAEAGPRHRPDPPDVVSTWNIGGTKAGLVPQAVSADGRVLIRLLIERSFVQSTRISFVQGFPQSSSRSLRRQSRAGADGQRLAPVGQQCRLAGQHLGQHLFGNLLRTAWPTD
jgi:hypothetical protein